MVKGYQTGYGVYWYSLVFCQFNHCLSYQYFQWLNFIPLQDGITILHIASYKGHEKIARYLCVQERVDVNVQDMVWYYSMHHFWDYCLHLLVDSWNKNGLCIADSKLMDIAKSVLDHSEVTI